MIRKVLDSQIRISRWFDGCLPEKYQKDGNYDFVKNLAPSYLTENQLVYDIGGGKLPFLSVEQKQKVNAKVVGVDVDYQELVSAPKGAYDELIVADILEYSGREDADVVICQSLLEHVEDTEKAFKAMASTLKPGGKAILFVPSRNAVFARLNILLPESVKKSALELIYPNTDLNWGFRAYYNRCVPSEFKAYGEKYNLDLTEQRYFYYSGYFNFFFPLHLLWRSWVFLFSTLKGDEGAETFSMVFTKR